MNAIAQHASAIYAEELTDGRWQVQITPKDSCMPSDWFEAGTIEAAAELALEQIREQIEYGEREFTEGRGESS